jgi:catechol 2,3-dioxygenase-like lactoylglutathione lyase family enzyme
MAMKRTGTPWMKADEFGRSLPRGIGVNLLVPDIAPMAAFCRDVLGATVIYADEDFAAVTLLGSTFMLHADHSYSDNAMTGVIQGVEVRGAGVEIRIYGLDPDLVETRAREHGHHVLAGSLDKPHGMRECHIVGPNAYVFVPTVAMPS